MTLLARNYGPFVRTRLPMHIYFVSGPSYIEEILVKQAANFRKDPMSQLLSRAIGQGLIVSEGDLWRRQRRLMQPAFHHGELQAYGAVMADLACDAVGAWGSDETRNVHEDMMALTLDIVAKLLFGADVGDQSREIGSAVGEVMEAFSGELGLRALTPLKHLPSRASWRIRRGVRRLDHIVYRLIAERQSKQDVGDDLLGLLLKARDEDGTRMTDAQLRDETLTLFVAGHETTALAMTYALTLLADHPDQQERLAAELARVLGGRKPTVADLPNLKRTEAVVLEAMRLYPPVWGIGRQALRDVQIGEYRLPKGSNVFMSQWVVHRDPALFPEPERFWPERWIDGQPDGPRPARFAYFPFGGGPRICIGNRFAMMEATLILAAVMQSHRVARTPDTKLDLLPTITLRPRGGVHLRVTSAPHSTVSPP